MEQLGKRLEQSLIIPEAEPRVNPRHSKSELAESNFSRDTDKQSVNNSLKDKLRSLKRRKKGFKKVQSKTDSHFKSPAQKGKLPSLPKWKKSSFSKLKRKNELFQDKLTQYSVKRQRKRLRADSKNLGIDNSFQLKSVKMLKSDKDKLDQKYSLDQAPRKADAKEPHSSKPISKLISSFIDFKQGIEDEPNPELMGIDDSKESIKCLVVNKYMEECNSDSDDLENQEILRDLNKPRTDSPFNTDKVRSAARQASGADDSDPWEPDRGNQSLVQSYMNFEKDFQDFALSSKNLLAFKACSLFSKNKLLEHPEIDVLCETSLNRTRSTWEVRITLTYMPVRQDTNLSARMITFEPIESIPKLIDNVPFNGSLVQSFSVKMIGCVKAPEFPKVILSLLPQPGFSGGPTRMELPVPFTINKFMMFESVSEQFMIEFIQNSLELAAFELALDDQLLVRAEDIIELLPNVLVFEDNLFCFLLDFGAGISAALKIEIVGELRIKICLYSSEYNDLFEMFVDWFVWMFQKKLQG